MCDNSLLGFKNSYIRPINNVVTYGQTHTYRTASRAVDFFDPWRVLYRVGARRSPLHLAGAGAYRP